MVYWHKYYLKKKLSPYFKRRKNSPTTRYLKTLENRQLNLILRFSFSISSVFPTIYVKSSQKLRLIYSRSMRVCLIKIKNYRDIFYRSGGLMKFLIWKLFFLKFVKHLPQIPFFMVFKSWEGQISPFLNIFTKSKHFRFLLVDNNRPYKIKDNKKLRRIKKKIKKKIFK